MNDLDWFHCNRCFGDVESHPEQTSFHLTTCGHIFCKSCLNQATKRLNQEIICFICEAPCTTLILDHKIPKEISKFFENPIENLEQVLEILKFQRTHHLRQLTHFKKLAYKQQVVLQKAKTELIALKELQKREQILQRQISTLEMENQNLMEENRKLKQHLNISLQNTSRQNLSNSLSNHGRGNVNHEVNRRNTTPELGKGNETPEGPKRLSLRTPTSKMNSPYNNPTISTPQGNFHLLSKQLNSHPQQSRGSTVDENFSYKQNANSKAFRPFSSFSSGDMSRTVMNRNRSNFPKQE